MDRNLICFSIDDVVDYKGAWVNAKGYNIPENAFVAGEERGEPLYVGRTKVEGTITPGRVRLRI